MWAHLSRTLSFLPGVRWRTSSLRWTASCDRMDGSSFVKRATTDQSRRILPAPCIGSSSIRRIQPMKCYWLTRRHSGGQSCNHGEMTSSGVHSVHSKVNKMSSSVWIESLLRRKLETLPPHRKPILVGFYTVPLSTIFVTFSTANTTSIWMFAACRLVLLNRREHVQFPF